jgi:hypothetical protein
MGRSLRGVTGWRQEKHPVLAQHAPVEGEEGEPRTLGAPYARLEAPSKRESYTKLSPQESTSQATIIA